MLDHSLTRRLPVNLLARFARNQIIVKKAKASMTASLPLRPLRILRVLCVKSLLPLALATTVHAQTANTEPFADVHDGGKQHTASGFICPAKIGAFERDAVGESNPGTHTDFCAYSALNGVYATIKLVPLDGPYNPQNALAPGFIEQESLGGKPVADGVVMLGVKPEPLAIYARTYETTKLEDLRYRVLFAGAQFQNWAVETTIEYADPRDTAVEDQFLHAVYAAARSEIVAK